MRDVLTYKEHDIQYDDIMRMWLETKKDKDDENKKFYILHIIVRDGFLLDIPSSNKEYLNSIKSTYRRNKG